VTFTDLIPLLPFIVLAATAVLSLLVIAFYRHHGLILGLTLVGLAVAFATLPFLDSGLPRQVTLLLIMDSYALFYIGLLLAASFAVCLLAYGYMKKQEGNHEELYLLLILATLGSAVLVASNHFVSFFLGLETLTVSLYGLIAYLRTTERSVEAGLKYLILAAVSSAFLLFGMALVYAELGTMTLSEVVSRLAGPATEQTVFLLTGLAMMVVGIGFKLAVVPFHMWTPDIYEGAPAPVTAFVATVSKGGMFALLLRYFVQIDVQAYGSVFLLFALIAIASMFAGNLLALLQSNVKRILAYSSIAHLGYLLVALLAGGTVAISSATYYLTAYFVTTLGAFGVVTVLSDRSGEAAEMEDYRGLFWHRPWLAGIFTATLLSLAGIPLTAGFIGKFYVVTAGIGSALWLLVIILIINSAIGLYYYLRIVVTMGLQPASTEAGPASATALPWSGSLALIVLIVALIWLGIYPAPLIGIIQATVSALI
jgi:NADH-quinone oxidoreductase subunit N